MSFLRNTLDLLNKFGFMDVILPFILVFTLVYGILQKTLILLPSNIKDKEGNIPEGALQKVAGLNAMIAFTIAFFVVLSFKVVNFIIKSSLTVSMILLSIFFFLMLVGAFFGESFHGFSRNTGLLFFFGILFGLVILVVVLYAWPIGNSNALEITLNYLNKHSKVIVSGINWTDVFSAIFGLGSLIAIVYFVTKPSK